LRSPCEAQRQGPCARIHASTSRNRKGAGRVVRDGGLFTA